MKLIEKKCPNCGAGLEFSDTDKSCKCQYCHRAFEIERDMNIDSSFEDQFNLSELQKPFQIFTFVYIFIIIIVGLIIMFSIAFSFSSSKSKVKTNKTDIVNGEESNTEDKEVLLEDISELSNKDFDSIDNKATIEINRTGEGVNDANQSYSVNGKIIREVLYIAYKEGSNYVIPIYKANYRDFFHQNNQYTVYIPIVFENIEKDVLFSLGNARLSAPEFYFNADKSSYTYGYASLDDAYNDLIKPLEVEYKISSK